MAGVSFRDVDKKYGDVAVIEDLNLEIRDQEFMVLVGPSGCGKSTALRMVVLGPGEEPRGEASPLRLEVEVVEPLGDEVIVHGKVADVTVVCKVDLHHVPEVGSALDAVVEVDEMHIFDAGTGERLGD
jgi:ABC-type sugar transport system ATPase subunit